ncbi:MAG: archaeosortase/exosortase family protein [Opitutales bacterium]
MPLRKQLADCFKEKRNLPDFWLHCLLFTLLGLALWPLTAWFAQTAHEQSRIFHALLVLGLASVLLVRFGGVEVENPLALGTGATRALCVSYGLLFLNYLANFFLKNPLFGLLIIPAYCAGLAAFLRFVFGEGTRRLTRTVAGTLCVFLLLSVWMEPLDWPLRNLAGEWSAYILGLLGKTVELGLIGQEDGPPMLILLVEQHPFNVAAECNGFGVILTSLLLALLLAIYRRLGAFDLGLNLFAGLIMGFAFNIIRIVIIVLLAPPLMEHYMLMHEIVGGLTYWACLMLVWILLNGPTKNEPASEALKS